jgi:PDZ domain
MEWRYAGCSVAALENRKIEGLRQFVLDAWMEMTANSEFARHRMKKRLRLILMGLFLALMFAHVCVHTFVSARYLSVLSAGWVQKWGQLEPIVQLVKEDGPAATLRRGDEIVMLNGRQIQDKYQIIKFLETASLGTAYTVVVKRHGQLREFTLRTGATPLSALALIGLAMVLVPLAYLLSGLIVFFLRSESKQALLLALGFGTVYLDSGSSLESLPWWLFALTVVARVGYALQPAFGLHFFLFFPETSPLVRRFPTSRVCYLSADPVVERTCPGLADGQFTLWLNAYSRSSVALTAISHSKSSDNYLLCSMDCGHGLQLSPR